MRTPVEQAQRALVPVDEQPAPRVGQHRLRHERSASRPEHLLPAPAPEPGHPAERRRDPIVAMGVERAVIDGERQRRRLPEAAHPSLPPDHDLLVVGPDPDRAVRRFAKGARLDPRPQDRLRASTGPHPVYGRSLADVDAPVRGLEQQVAERGRVGELRLEAQGRRPEPVQAVLRAEPDIALRILEELGRRVST